VAEAREATVSLRWVFPFLRITRVDPGNVQIFAREGISLSDFARPETRIRHRVAMELLEAAIASTGDARLGLRAAENVEPGDLDTLEFAARSCATLREAVRCIGRYMSLMHGALESELVEDASRAAWELQTTDNVAQLGPANDFALAVAYTFVRRYTGKRGVLKEVHLRHAVATSASEYERVFEGATIRLGMPRNALVFKSGVLDAPMLYANPGLQAAFEAHASALVERLRRKESVAGRVRQLIMKQLSTGDVSMPSLARKLAMSVATLRRRLIEEGTSQSEILDDVRCELAEEYLADRSLTMGDIALLLGFSHVTAFYKAFRRWSNGVTPAEFRAQVRQRERETSSGSGLLAS